MSRRPDARLRQLPRRSASWPPCGGAAAAAHARAEAERRDAAAEEARRIEADSRAEAERIRAIGRERVPALAAEVVALLLEDA